MIVLYPIYVALAVIFLFSITIFIHELGHYLAARATGMVIDAFSIGFGPAIWKKKINGTTYKIGIIPVGGYVALPQIDPALTETEMKNREQTAEENKPLPPIAPWKKIIVIAAGATGNMILAIALAWIVFWMGKPSTLSERSSLIGFVQEDSEAYSAGLRAGHEIITVNNIQVANWQEIMERAMHDERAELTVKTPDSTIQTSLATEKSLMGIKTIPGISPASLCKIAALMPGMSAEAAGLKPGDIIKKFNNKPVFSIPHLTQLVNEAKNTEAPVEVERAGELLTLHVTPEYSETHEQTLIGIRFSPDISGEEVVHIPPGVQIKRHATAIFRVLGMLLTPKTSKTTAQGLGGPVMIIYFFQDVVRQGPALALWFTCFINVNLAILNLLPIPVLDGGHILFCTWELVTRRRVHPKVFQWTSQIFAILLIGAVILLTFKDTKVLLQIHGFFTPAPDEQNIEKNISENDE